MIHIRGLVKRHGDETVLNGIDLEVKHGEISVIIGPSGGGKSTLLRCINGLERFEDGEIRVTTQRNKESSESYHLTPRTDYRKQGKVLEKLRRQVTMVFQQFHLFPHLTVLDNVLCGPIHVLNQERPEAEAQAEQLLKRVGLLDKIKAMPDQLSGGQQQRVAIARALALKPEAILFDEPTSALDPKMAREVRSVIEDLAATVQTMVIVTHAMGLARKIGHVVHVMEGGKIVESGEPEQIFENAQHRETRSFLEQVMTD